MSKAQRGSHGAAWQGVEAVEAREIVRDGSAMGRCEADTSCWIPLFCRRASAAVLRVGSGGGSGRLEAGRLCLCGTA